MFTSSFGTDIYNAFYGCCSFYTVCLVIYSYAFDVIFAVVNQLELPGKMAQNYFNFSKGGKLTDLQNYCLHWKI